MGKCTSIRCLVYDAPLATVEQPHKIKQRVASPDLLMVHPSSVSATTDKSLGLETTGPFRHTRQHAQHTELIVPCSECCKPRYRQLILYPIPTAIKTRYEHGQHDVFQHGHNNTLLQQPITKRRYRLEQSRWIFFKRMGRYLIYYNKHKHIFDVEFPYYSASACTVSVSLLVV